MALSDIRAALVSTLAGVTGIGPVTGHPIKGIPGNRSVYLVRNGFEVVPAGRVKARRWRFVARLTIYWQEPEASERELDEMTTAILAAFDDPYLGGALSAGTAEITEGDDDWYQTKNSDAWYRYCDFDIVVLDKTVS